MGGRVWLEDLVTVPECNREFTSVGTFPSAQVVRRGSRKFQRRCIHVRQRDGDSIPRRFGMEGPGADTCSAVSANVAVEQLGASIGTTQALLTPRRASLSHNDVEDEVRSALRTGAFRITFESAGDDAEARACALRESESYFLATTPALLMVYATASLRNTSPSSPSTPAPRALVALVVGSLHDYIQALYVLPRFQRLGVGREIVRLFAAPCVYGVLQSAEPFWRAQGYRPSEEVENEWCRVVA